MHIGILDAIQTRATRRLWHLMPLLAVVVSLASCVVSDKPLLSNAKPLLGPHFTVQLFRHFSNGKSGEIRTSVFAWKDGAYVNTGGNATDLSRFIATPLHGDDMVLQGSNAKGKVYAYWLSRKFADGAYLILPLDETYLDVASREKLCAKDQPAGFCLVDTAEKLAELSRATAASPIKNAEIAVIIADGLTVTPIRVSR